MEKIEVSVLGLASNPSGNNAYSLILKEVGGDKRLPIIIGAFEAQAIALEMEGVMPPRPMTHDLFKSFIQQTGARLSEVYINDLTEGTFFSKLVFEDTNLEIDSRPSDAIAMAVRFKVPIYVSSYVFEETGVSPGFVSDVSEANKNYNNSANQTKYTSSGQSQLSLLQQNLNKAISAEEYETAASLRDKIKILLEKQ